MNKNYITPSGWNKLKKELYELVNKERPKIVEIVSWAASNGDRSENGDYIYGKKRLKEIDKRIYYLTKQLDNSEVVDPQLREETSQVFFGATVDLLMSNGKKQTISIVGKDEIDLSKGKVSWMSPIARCIMKTNIGDEVIFNTLEKKEIIEILDVRYVKIED